MNSFGRQPLTNSGCAQRSRPYQKGTAKCAGTWASIANCALSGTEKTLLADTEQLFHDIFILKSMGNMKTTHFIANIGHFDVEIVMVGLETCCLKGWHFNSDNGQICQLHAGNEEKYDSNAFIANIDDGQFRHFHHGNKQSRHS